MLDEQFGGKPRRRSVSGFFGAAVGWIAWIGWIGIGACDRDDSDPPGQSDTEADASSGEAPGESSGGGANGEPAECDVAAGEGACAELDVCDVFDCGGKTAPFNHYGCPRVPCSADADCGEGERCFAVALDTGCRAAPTCAAVGDSCECGMGELACAGTNEAHCLPVGFYPESGDCEVEALACEELAARAEAVETARQLREAANEGELVDALVACATRIESAQRECPEGGVR